jgi:hypothetical protein
MEMDDSMGRRRVVSLHESCLLLDLRHLERSLPCFTFEHEPTRTFPDRSFAFPSVASLTRTLGSPTTSPTMVLPAPITASAARSRELRVAVKVEREQVA